MFSALIENSPEILTALGVSPEVIAAETNKQQAVEKLKVKTCFITCLRTSW